MPWPQDTLKSLFLAYGVPEALHTAFSADLQALLGEPAPLDTRPTVPVDGPLPPPVRFGEDLED